MKNSQFERFVMSYGWSSYRGSIVLPWLHLFNYSLILCFLLCKEKVVSELHLVDANLGLLWYTPWKMFTKMLHIYIKNWKWTFSKPLFYTMLLCISEFQAWQTPQANTQEMFLKGRILHCRGPIFLPQGSTFFVLGGGNYFRKTSKRTQNIS